MPTRDGDFTKRAITEEGLLDAIKLLDGTEKAYRYSLESLANRIAALRQKEMQIRLGLHAVRWVGLGTAVGLLIIFKMWWKS